MPRRVLRIEPVVQEAQALRGSNAGDLRDRFRSSLRSARARHLLRHRGEVRQSGDTSLDGIAETPLSPQQQLERDF